MDDNLVSVRLNKALSEAGVCSRREADRLVEQGKVMVDGVVATLGQRVTDEQRITVRGKEVPRGKASEIVLAFHKPKGVVCTTSKIDKDNIIDYIKYPERIYPMGRLDKESTGLILLTNNGELMEALLRSRNGHEKEYVVVANMPIREEHLVAMSQGIPILETVTKPCKIERITNKSFSIILTQGLNRQIRRMCQYFDYHVRDLKRVRIENILLGDLPEGQYRMLTSEELSQLKRITGISQ